MNRTHSPATTLPSGRRLLIALLVISSAASPPLSPGQSPGTDTLSLRLLELEIEEARQEAESHETWRRLIPSVRLSASLGAAEVYFQDEPGALMLPRDAYRITCSLSLNTIFDTGPRRRALLRIEKLQTEHEILSRGLERQRSKEQVERAELQRSLAATEAELSLRERIARFYRMRFEQGELEYPTLARAELELLALRVRLTQLTSQLQQRSPSFGPEYPTQHEREKSP